MKIAALRAFGSGLEENLPKQMHSHFCRFQGSNPGVLRANDENKRRTSAEIDDEKT